MDDNSKYTGAYADLLTQIAENVEAVYAAGVKSEYDRFWDAFQENGNKTTYDYAFSGRQWGATTFKPKYNIVPINATSLFHNNNHQFDLAEQLNACGVVLDLSNATNLAYAFYATGFTRIPVINTTSATDLARLFGANSYVKRIDKVILKDDGSQALNKGFETMSGLENITFEGTIGNNFDIHWSTKLTHESLMSVINCLKDYSGSGSTYTCTLGTTNLAKLTDAEKAIATEKGWTLA